MSTKKIAVISVLTAISILLNVYTVLLKNFAVSFAYIPPFLAGALLGPFSGLAVGLVGDIMGWVINPLGPFNPFIAVSSGLLGFIPGMVFKFSRFNDYLKIFMSFILIFIICTTTLNTVGLWLMYGGGRTFLAYLAVRLPLQAPVWAINLVIVAIVFKPVRMLENRLSFR
ncbi:MAG: folate family ECF transporter S component [Bacillota bacterium]